MENYRKYKTNSGIDIVKDPLSVQFDKHVATDSSTWYRYQWGINAVADENKVVKVTGKINPALKDIGRRKDAAKVAFRVINKESQLCKQRWELTLDQVHGW
jgi:predicted chitinase